MTLHFPNARLFIHDLTARQKLSGVRALAKGAHEYGLIPFEAIADIDRLEGNASCQCFAAAREILHRHFKAKSKGQGAQSVSIEDVCSSFERDFKAYEKRLSEDRCQANDQPICARLAPALFDLLLQQVRRFP